MKPIGTGTGTQNPNRDHPHTLRDRNGVKITDRHGAPIIVRRP